MDAPRPPQAGYGLPCAKCHRYFPADVNVCPYCKTQERVSAVVVPKVSTLPKVQDPVKPTAHTVALEQEREKLLELLKPPMVVTKAEAGNSPSPNNLDRGPGKESDAIPRPPKVQVPTEPVRETVSPEQRRGESVEQFKSKVLMPQAEMSGSPAPGKLDHHPAEKELATVPMPLKVQSPAEGVYPQPERKEFLKQVKSPVFAGQTETGKPLAPGGEGHDHSSASEPRLAGLPDSLPELARPQEREINEQARRNESAAVRSAVTRKNGNHPDRVTVVLGVVVLAFALLLIALVGLRFGWYRTPTAFVPKASSTNSTASGAPQQNVNSPDTNASSLPTGGAERSSSTTAPSGVVTPPAGPTPISETGKESLHATPSATGEKQRARVGAVEHSSSVKTAPVFTLLPDAAENALVHRVEPVYPEEARRQGIQGTVVLDLHIGKDGAVRKVDLVSGPSLLADASTAAVKQWQFKPHSIDGREVEMQTRTTLSFTLPNP
jgi:TonB family protein